MLYRINAEIFKYTFMNTTNFRESNYVNAKTAPAVNECRNSHISDGVKHNWTVTCHTLTFWERLRVLFIGKIWAVRIDLDQLVLSTEKSDVL